MKKFLFGTILFSAFVLHSSTMKAQEIDLNDPCFDGIELEYFGSTLTAGATVFLDLTYWNLFASHEKGWNGGDGVYSTTLPDGNTFWSFGDSFFGVVSEFRNRTRSTNFPRNAAMIQTSEKSWKDWYVCNEYINTNPNKRDHYYNAKTWVRNPRAKKLSEADINNGSTDADRFYWPGDATVIKVDGKPVLQVLFGAVDENMARDETALAEFSLDGTPGDGEYMRLIKLYPEFVPYTQGYGSGIFEDPDGHSYLYSSIGTSYGMGAVGIVARSATHDLKSEWEYYIKDEDGNFHWQKELPTTEECQRSDITGGDWVSNPSVFKYNDYYYLVSEPITSGDVQIFQSEYPWGPFKNPKSLYKIPSDQYITYNAFIHPQFSRSGELVISYNMNAADITTITADADGNAVENTQTGFWRNYNSWGSADLYQPHFIRVFNWQNLFGVENTGPTFDYGIEEYNKMD